MEDWTHETPMTIRCNHDGSWGAWSTWSECSATCGGGSRTKTRECNDPPPEFDGANCQGLSYEKSECNAQKCPIDGNWGAWSSWSECSATCGGGIRTKTRECNDPPSAFNGDDCQGLSIEESECKAQKCPIDGNWGAWSAWSECSATCGRGIQTKTRECNDPPSAFNGADCQGLANEELECDTEECAGTVFIYYFYIH